MLVVIGDDDTSTTHAKDDNKDDDDDNDNDYYATITTFAGPLDFNCNNGSCNVLSIRIVMMIVQFLLVEQTLPPSYHLFMD